MVFLDRFPVWLIYIGTVAIAFATAEIGYRIGVWLRSKDPSLGESSMTSSLVSGMLSLIAFLLALSAATVIGQHNNRKAMVVTEANAVETAFLRAGFLDEPDRNLSRDLLREYVEVRLAAAADVTLVDSSIKRSEEIHGQLWSILEDDVRQGHDSETMALYVESINHVLSTHKLRVTALYRRIPRNMGLMLYAAILFSFLILGIASSRDGKRIHPFAILLFAMAFVAILVGIVNLDRIQQGDVTTSQKALLDLLQKMTTDTQ
jgi:hypothetical protein